MTARIKKCIKCPMFYIQLIVTVTAPTLAYMGISLKNITTWEILGNIVCDSISNPYIILLSGVNLMNFLMGPQTAKNDSNQEMPKT